MPCGIKLVITNEIHSLLLSWRLRKRKREKENGPTEWETGHVIECGFRRPRCRFIKPVNHWLQAGCTRDHCHLVTSKSYSYTIYFKSLHVNLFQINFSRGEVHFFPVNANKTFRIWLGTSALAGKKWTSPLNLNTNSNQTIFTSGIQCTIYICMRLWRNSEGANCRESQRF